MVKSSQSAQGHPARNQVKCRCLLFFAVSTLQLNVISDGNKTKPSHRGCKPAQLYACAKPGQMGGKPENPA